MQLYSFSFVPQMSASITGTEVFQEVFYLMVSSGMHIGLY